MSNEIKQGDKVRVSKDAPWLYVGGLDRIFAISDSVVTAIEDDNAAIKCYHGQAARILIIPTKYLVKVDAEAFRLADVVSDAGLHQDNYLNEDKKEPKFKVGDKVVRKNVSTVRTITGIESVSDETGTSYYYDTVDSQGNNPMDFLESELIHYAESTPKYKKGDRVKICSKNADRFGCVGTILEVHDNGTVDVDFNDYYVGGHLYSVDFIEPYTEPTEQTEAEKKPNVGSIKIPVEVDIKKVANEYAEAISNAIREYGDALCKHGTFIRMVDDLYKRDLAKEVALKVANKYNDPKEAAEYAVLVAKAVVEGLKRK